MKFVNEGIPPEEKAQTSNKRKSTSNGKVQNGDVSSAESSDSEFEAVSMNPGVWIHVILVMIMIAIKYFYCTRTHVLEKACFRFVDGM